MMGHPSLQPDIPLFLSSPPISPNSDPAHSSTDGSDSDMSGLGDHLDSASSKRDLEMCEIRALLAKHTFNPTFEADPIIQHSPVLRSYLNIISDFYKKDPDRLIKYYVPIVVYYKHLPLRFLNHLVSNYCNTHSCLVPSPYGGTIELRDAYAQQMSLYRKCMMDVYARGNWGVRVYPFTDRSICMETTLPQLYFFRFAWQYNIIPYALTHVDVIIASLQHEKQNKKNSIKRKSKSTPRMLSTYVKPVIGADLAFNFMDV